jgi:hypothetical protein
LKPFWREDPMNERAGDIQNFLDAARLGFGAFLKSPQGLRAVEKAFKALAEPGLERAGPGSRLAVCSHLEQALDPGRLKHPSLIKIAEVFRLIEPRLEWRTRETSSTASDNFSTGHANALIVGPNGLERRADVWLGVSLLAPQVRYPDHRHPPEEAYLVLSSGEFRQGENDWFVPGIGGTLYNRPDIVHAMRSDHAPLFALWCLPID